MELYISSYKLGNKTYFIKKWIKQHNCNNILSIINARYIYVKDDIEKNRILEDIHMLEYCGFNVEILNGLELVVSPVNPHNYDYVNYVELGFIRETNVPHYKSKHKSSKQIDSVIEYLEKNHLSYIAL